MKHILRPMQWLTHDAAAETIAPIGAHGNCQHGQPQRENVHHATYAMVDTSCDTWMG